MKRKGVERGQAAKELIQKVYERYNGVYGSQIQLFLLHDHGVWMNHKKVLRIMQDLGIRSL
ncbi:transposase [Paenibacillus terrae]